MPQGFFRPSWSKIILTLVYSAIILLAGSILISFFGGTNDLCLPRLGQTEDQGNPIDFNLADNLNISSISQDIFRGYCSGDSIPFVITLIHILFFLAGIFLAYFLSCLTVALFGKLKKSNKTQTKLPN
jgi:hypothetical protein